VHTTFVRSVDLDEWTQRQIDAMRLGGNGNARQYFRKQGFTDMYGKIEKKYNSKAAQTYRTELAKLVDAQSAQRGEVILSTTSASMTEDTSSSSVLLENLSLADQKEQQQQQAALKATNGGAAAVATAQPVLKLASQLPGAKGRLATPPNSGNGPKLILRKLSSGGASTSSTNSGKHLLKKAKPPTSGGSKLRVNKMTIGGGSGSNDSMDNDGGAMTNGGGGDFDDLHAHDEGTEEPTEAAATDAVLRERDEPAPLAVSANIATPVVAPAPLPPPTSSSPMKTMEPRSSMDQNMAKLKALNNDFFAGF